MIRQLVPALWLLVLVAPVAPAQAQQPTQAQASAIRSACRGDYQGVCANVPTGGKEALQCLQQHADAVSPGCREALAPLSAGQPAPSAGAAGTTPPPRQLSPREEIRLLRADCGADYRRYCADVQPGGGRAVECLRSHGPQLSKQCQSALLSAQKP